MLRAEALAPEELLELLGRLDEPFCDPAFVPTHALSELTRRHVKVALSGDGGDEVFGGYPKYLLGQAERRPLPLASLFDRSLRTLSWRPRRMASVYWRVLSSQDRIRFAWARYGNFPVFAKTCASSWRAPTKMRLRWMRILNRGSDERSAMGSASIPRCLCVPI